MGRVPSGPVRQRTLDGAGDVLLTGSRVPGSRASVWHEGHPYLLASPPADERRSVLPCLSDEEFKLLRDSQRGCKFWNQNFRSVRRDIPDNTRDLSISPDDLRLRDGRDALRNSRLHNWLPGQFVEGVDELARELFSAA